MKVDFWKLDFKSKLEWLLWKICGKI